MNKQDITSGLIVRAKNPDNFNYQIELDKHKSVYSHARVTSVSKSLKNGINTTFVYYIPFKYWCNGLVSCCTLREFNKQFKKVKFS